MSDDRRLPSRAVGARGRRALVATAAAAAVVIVGGIAVASAVESGPEDPSVTDVTLDTGSTETTAADTTSSSTTDTTAGDTDTDDGDGDGDTTTTTAVAPDDGGTEAEGAEHPDNHGKVVSEAAKDHSQDEAYGNHGRYVSGVARGEIDPTTDTTADAAGSAKPGKGRKGG